MKKIIQASGRPDDLFLTLVNEQGVITSANSNMIKELHLDDPRSRSTNLFDLVHPTQLPGFKKLFNSKPGAEESQGIELYVKNGHLSDRPDSRSFPTMFHSVTVGLS